MSTPTQAPAPQAAAQPQQSSQQGVKPEAQAPAEAPRKMKLKFDGQEVEMAESEVIAFAQQGKVATQRFEEASKMRKEAEQILEFAKQNPKEFFAKTGMNARQWAEEYLMQELQNESLTPEQRKAKANEDKLREFENEAKKRQEAEKQAQIDRMTNEKRQELEQVFIKALNESGLPKTPFTVKRMAELQLLNIKNKYELSSSQLAKMVREDYANEQKSLIGSMEGDQLIDYLGADIVKKLSKAQIAKLKAKAQPVQTRSTKSKDEKQSEQSLSWSEYQKRNRGFRK